ncbi:methylation-associated defense system restriction endonuclease subunit S MAD5 [Deinococcus sp. PESE-13]
MKVGNLQRPVTSAWLSKEAHRLDAPPFLSGAVEARVLLDKLHAPKQPLRDVSLNLLNPGRTSRTWVTDPEFGIPFLRSSDILAADLSRLPLISKKAIGGQKKFLLEEGWTLVTRSGTIGRMAYARPEMAGMACSEDVLRVIPNPDVIPPGYLYAYLSSRFGKTLVTSGTYGAIIQHIEPEHIADLQVPRFGKEFEERVHGLVSEGAERVSAFQRGIREATKRFFESVGLNDISSVEWHANGPDLGFEAPASQKTLRGMNFNPRFFALQRQIQAGPHAKLGDLTQPGTLRRGDRFKRVEAEESHAYKLVGQKDLFQLEPEGRWIAKSSLGPGSLGSPGLILAAAQGTLGENEVYCRSEFVWSTGIEMAYSEHVLRIQPDESKMLPGCLFAFMRSEMAFRMLRSISSGSKLQDNHYKLLPELPIPLPDRRTQEEVHKLVTDAYENRWRGVELENQARHLVEQAIEKNFVPPHP